MNDITEDEIVTISIIKKGTLAGSIVFDSKWSEEDIEIVRSVGSQMYKESEDMFSFTLEGERKIIRSGLRREMESIMHGWQGSFGINNCQDEEEVIRLLESIGNDEEATEYHSAAAFEAYMLVKPIYNILQKYK
ncbi:hypothetical protein GQR36_26750 [Enterococcus termitis]